MGAKLEWSCGESKRTTWLRHIRNRRAFEDV
jgi:hypothetical protein